MAAPLTIQLNISNGVSSEEGPFARLLRVPGGEEGECLLAVAEAQGPEGAEVCDNALDYLARAFAAGNLSISRRMLDGLKGIHQGLAGDNRTSLPEHKVTLGIVLGFVRGEDLYLAQAGSASAYLIDNEGCHLLTTGGEGSAEVLGGPRPPQLVVRRLRLQAGQRVLFLAGGNYQNSCDGPLIPAFQAGVEEGMMAVFRRCRGAKALGALALEVPGGEPHAYPTAQAVRYGGGRRNRPQGDGTPDTDFSYDPLPVETPGRGISISLKPPPVRVPNPLAGLVPTRAYYIAAVVFILIGLLLLGRACLDQATTQARAQVVQMLGAAADQERKAGEADTNDRRRDLLSQAAGAYETVLQRNPNEPDAQSGLQRVRRALTVLDAIYTFNDLRVITDFSQSVGGNVLARDLVSTPSGLLVLDKGSDRVIQVAPSFVQGGDQATSVSVFAQSANRGRRNLSHLLWMGRAPSWPRDSVLAVDDNRALLELTAAAEPRQLTLRGAGDWESMGVVRGYNGTLFVLDPKASQVWRYAPTESGFDTERRPALPSLDLRDAVDLNIDGSFYVLLKTGRVLKVAGGRAVPFSLDGLDKPLLSPVALTTTADLTSLYVLDQGNRRVVEFDKESGRFLRQFPLGDTPAVHDLWVDTEHNTLYLVTDRQLYGASLPKG